VRAGATGPRPLAVAALAASAAALAACGDARAAATAAADWAAARGAGLRFDGDARPAAAAGDGGAAEPGAAAAVAVAPDGRRLVAWVTAPGGGSDGRLRVAAVDAAGRAGSPAAELRDPLGAIEPHGEAPPKLAFGPGGAVYALWAVGKEVPGRRFPMSALRFARSDDGGRSWSAPVSVTDRPQPFGSFNFHALQAARGDTVFAAWLDGRDGRSATYLARSVDGGRTWGANVRVNAGGESCPCCRTAVAPGRGDTVYAAWRDVARRADGTTVREVVVARSADGGRTWGAPVRAQRDGWVFPGCPHAGPSLAVDAGGAVHVAWWSGREGARARSTPAAPTAARASAPRCRSAWPRTRCRRTCSSPSPARARGGGAPAVVAAWDDGTARVPRVLVRVSRDGGRTFAPAAVASPAGAAATYPVLAAGDGRLALAWTATARRRGRARRGRRRAAAPTRRRRTRCRASATARSSCARRRSSSGPRVDAPGGRSRRSRYSGVARTRQKPAHGRSGGVARRRGRRRPRRRNALRDNALSGGGGDGWSAAGGWRPPCLTGARPTDGPPLRPTPQTPSNDPQRLPRRRRRRPPRRPAIASAQMAWDAPAPVGGTRSTDAQLQLGGNYSPNLAVEWAVTAEAGLLRYSYTFTGFQAPGISHLIVGLSESCRTSTTCVQDVRVNSTGVAAGNVSFDDWGLSSSNPGLPGSVTFFGVKIDTPQGVQSQAPVTFSFLSDRTPVYGDFYAKGGGQRLRLQRRAARGQPHLVEREPLRRPPGHALGGARALDLRAPRHRPRRSPRRGGPPPPRLSAAAGGRVATRPPGGRPARRPDARRARTQHGAGPPCVRLRRVRAPRAPGASAPRARAARPRRRRRGP
jgi:hypothetical protein